MAREQINFKLPASLIAALKARAKEENTTSTDLVIRGLNHVLGLTTEQPPESIYSSVESRLHQLESRLGQVSSVVESGIDDRLHQLEARLEQIEAISVDNSIDERMHQLELRLEGVDSGIDERLHQLEVKLTGLVSQKLDAPLAIAVPANGQQTQEPGINEPQLRIDRSLAKRQGLTQAALAKRLKVDRSRVSRVQSQSNFTKWSIERDPEGIGWQFNPRTKRFYPQIHPS